MASYTTNLNLKKPAGSENVAIGDINNNMDIIDQAFGTINATLINTPTDNHRFIINGASSMGDFIESLRLQFITEFPFATTPYARSITIIATWSGHDYYVGTFARSSTNYIGILMTTGYAFQVNMTESASSYKTITMT